MENRALKELLEVKFTHISAKIDAQGVLLEEKMKRDREYISERLEEVIRHQKTANGNVARLQEESDKCREHRVIADSKIPWWKRVPVIVAASVAFTVMGIGIDDHYNIKALEKHNSEIQQNIWSYVEAKSRSYESMTKGNYEAIRSLDSAQAKIDSFLIEKYRVRSLRGNQLPEF